MRRILIRTRHGLLLAALLCVLLARTAVPAGWMPMADAGGGIVLAPCSGMGAMTVSGHDMAGMSGMPHVSPEKDDRHPDPAGDHPCSGAGISVALALPAPDLPRALVLRPVVLPIPVPVATIGQGLAAPPPPQTGPPLRV